MKTFCLCPTLIVLVGCLIAGDSHAEELKDKRLIVNGVTPDHVKQGLTVATALVNSIDTKDFSTVMKDAVSAASKYLGILNPLVGFIFSLFGSGPSAEYKLIKQMFTAMQHRFDHVDQQFAELHKAIAFVPTQVRLDDIEGNIVAVQKEYVYLASATNSHGFNSQKHAFLQTYDRTYQGAGSKLYHAIMSGTVASHNTGLFQEFAKFTDYDRKETQHFMLGAFGLLLKAAALEITYATLHHYQNIEQRKHDWVTQIQHVVSKMNAVDRDIVNNYHIYSGNDIHHNEALYNGVHQPQDLANHLFHKLTTKWYWRDWMVMVSTSHDSHYYGVHACEVNGDDNHGYTLAIASVPKTARHHSATDVNRILHNIHPLVMIGGGVNLRYECINHAMDTYNSVFPHETKLCGTHPWQASGIFCSSKTHTYVLASSGRYHSYTPKSDGSTAFLFG